MKIREGNINDLKELQRLFVDTITQICKSDYDNSQINAWTLGIENEVRWQNILTNQFVLVSQVKDKITGFCTLDKGNHIDLLYTNKNYQRQGIANKLYTEIEKEARRKNQSKLTVDASKTARPFFLKMGFKLLKEQTVVVKEVELTNYKMTKTLN